MTEGDKRVIEMIGRASDRDERVLGNVEDGSRLLAVERDSTPAKSVQVTS